MDVGGRGSTSGGRQKRGGISLPVHLWAYLDQIVELRTAAFKEAVAGMATPKKKGSKVTKASMSEEMEKAVAAHIRAFFKEHGPLPVNDAERRAYVKKLAEWNSKEALRDLHEDP